MGSSGPRQCAQIATGAGAYSAPQLRQRSGRAVSGRVLGAAGPAGPAGPAIAVSCSAIGPPQQKSPGNRGRGRSLFSSCLTWQQYAANHHEASIVTDKMTPAAAPVKPGRVNPQAR